MTPILFSVPSYAELGESICQSGGFQAGQLKLSRFPDGERYMRITTDVREKDAILLAGSYSDEASLEAFDLACGLVNNGARRLSIILPYFGYATMERESKKGEVITAKNRARLFSAIPRAPYGNRVFTVDLHSEGIPHYFEGGVQVFHVYAKEAVIDAARQLGGIYFISYYGL